MGILIAIFYICILAYSLIGGIIIFGRFATTPMGALNKKVKKEKFSKTNRIFSKELIKYTLIVSFPTYFMCDIFNYINIKFNASYYYTMLVVPIILWANTIIVMLIVFLDSLFGKKK
jgi:hypothetical protein